MLQLFFDVAPNSSRQARQLHAGSSLQLHSLATIKPRSIMAIARTIKALVQLALSLSLFATSSSALIDNGHSHVVCKDDTTHEVLLDADKGKIFNAIRTPADTDLSHACTPVEGYTGIKDGGSWWSAVDLGGAFVSVWASKKTGEMYVCKAQWEGTGKTCTIGA